MTRYHILTLLAGIIAGAAIGIVITFLSDGAFLATPRHIIGYAGIGGLASHLATMKGRRKVRRESQEITPREPPE